MTDDSTMGTHHKADVKCSHGQCETELSGHTYRDVGTGETYCCRYHLLADANGDDIDD